MKHFKLLVNKITERYKCDEAAAEKVIGIAKALHSDFENSDSDVLDFVISVSYKFLCLSDKVESLQQQLENIKSQNQFNS